jgi:hypothetical protein
VIDHDLLLVILDPKAPRLAPSRPGPRPGRPRRDLPVLLRYRDQAADDWADIIDMLTMCPEARRQVCESWQRSGAEQR